jgi:antitoxin component YwqK of YwqJK toxin-antitoxin module
MKPKVNTSYYSNGQKMRETHRLNGNFHNENGPAFQEWYRGGQIRREEYWLNGKQVTKEQVMTLIKIKKFLNETEN